MILYCKTCRRDTVWKMGKALDYSRTKGWVSADFPGDYEGPDLTKAKPGQTITPGSADKFISCLKCINCGRSIRA